MKATDSDLILFKISTFLFARGPIYWGIVWSLILHTISFIFTFYWWNFWKSHKMTLTSHVTFWFFEKKSWPVTLTFLKKIFLPWLVTWLFDYFLKKDVTRDFDFWLVLWENDWLWQFLVQVTLETIKARGLMIKSRATVIRFINLHVSWAFFLDF